MRISSILMALVGLAVAGGSAQMAREILTAPRAEARAGEPLALVDVYVAATEIKFGDILQPHMLSTQSWPPSAVPAGAFTDRALLFPATGGEPRRATGSIKPGELILTSKVSDFGQKVTIVQNLAPNTRAVALKVDAVTAVGGFVTPGDAVDILLTRGGNDDLATSTILRNIRVVAVDQSADQNNDAPDVATTVTVEATPAQSQILALAQRAGTLSLALRTLDADDTVPLERLRLSDLVPDQAEEPVLEVAEVAPAPAPLRRTVLVRRAGVAEEVTLRD